MIRILDKMGFESIRQEGSHVFLRHPDGRTTVVLVHPGEEIKERFENYSRRIFEILVRSLL